MELHLPLTLCLIDVVWRKRRGNIGGQLQGSLTKFVPFHRLFLQLDDVSIFNGAAVVHAPQPGLQWYNVFFPAGYLLCRCPCLSSLIPNLKGRLRGISSFSCAPARGRDNNEVIGCMK